MQLMVTFFFQLHHFFRVLQIADVPGCHVVHFCATQAAKTQCSFPCPPHKPVMNIDLINGILVLGMGYEADNGRCLMSLMYLWGRIMVHCTSPEQLVPNLPIRDSKQKPAVLAANMWNITRPQSPRQWLPLTHRAPLAPWKPSLWAWAYQLPGSVPSPSWFVQLQ